MAAVDHLLANVARTLRYVAAPVVALVLIWLVDPDHDVIIAMTQTGASPVPGKVLAWTDLTSWWPVAGFVGAAGVCVYHLHRAVAHPILSFLILGIIRYTRLGSTLGEIPKASELDFARWHRRGMPKDRGAGAAQATLDEANAAAHFLYCTGWCLWLFPPVLSAAFGSYFNACDRAGIFGLLGLGFLLLGAYDDYTTTRKDIEAFHRYPECR